jgi:hypothetical protein
LQLRVLWLNLVAFCWATFLILHGRGAGKLAPKLQPRLAAR